MPYSDTDDQRMPVIPPQTQVFGVSVVAIEDIDTRFRAAWRSLDEDLAVPNPYFSEWFLGPSLKRLAPKDAIRLCIVTRVGDGALVGLFPFEIGTRYARLPLRHVGVWQNPHGYDGTPLLRRGCSHDAFAAVLDWIDQRPFGARFLRLTRLPYGTVMRGIVSDTCARTNRVPRTQLRTVRACLSAGEDHDALMAAAMSGKKRKELRRQERRFGELGRARIVELPVSDSGILQAAEQFIDLENAGWKATAAYGEPLARSDAERSFFIEAMRAGAGRGAVSCLALMLDHDPVAMLFCLRSGAHLSAFKTAYDENHAAYSPGMRLLIEATRRMLDDPDIAHLDSCARPGHPVVDRLWSQRLPVVQLNIPANHAGDAALLDLAAIVERAKRRVLDRVAS